jgi:hypothetical protein
MNLLQNLCVAALLATTCMGQAGAPEPEFVAVFYRLDGERLIPLERQTPTTKGGAGGFVFVSVKMAAEFPGSKSPIRFASGPLSFVVRLMAYGAMGDPNATYILRKLEQKKSTRRLVFMSGHFSPVGGSMATNFVQGGLPVKFTKYGDGSLKMTTGALAPGEYAVSKAYPGQAVFCFGVDK